MNVILKVENISKQYRLGTVGTGTLSHDLNRWWHQVRGKKDPYAKVGVVNDRSQTASSDYVWALKDINFDVRTGEVLGIIGKNGAGKSTLLKILSKVTSPTTGVIKTRGRIASLLEVGTGFHPELTGRENIFLNGAILGMTKGEIRNKLAEIVDFSGCEMYIDTPVKRYSSGMRVRLAFAVAAHLEPEILVVDEVLAVGDAEFQKKAIGKMQDISKGEGRTVLFVSHNMSSIQQLCSRVMLLDKGHILQDGPTTSVIESYLEVHAQKGDANTVKSINEAERKGSGRIKLKKAEVVSTSASKIPVTGKPLSFKFHLDNPEKISLKNLELDFRIDDHLGQRLVWLSTSIYDHQKDEIAHCIVFELDKNPLNQGTFNVTTHLSFKKEICDWAKNAFQFQVAEGFFYPSKKAVQSAQSKLLVPFEIFYLK